MVIKAALRKRTRAAQGGLRLVLRRKKDGLADELDVVQDAPAAHALFVVPVDHGALVGGVHGLVVEIPARRKAAAAQLSRKLRPLLDQRLVVRQLHVKEIPALLQVGDPRLPIEIQRIDAFDRNVAPAAVPAPVPEDAVDGNARLELLPPVVGPGLLKVVLIQNHGQDLGKKLRLGLVVRSAGETGGLGVGVHRVRVLREDDVDQPGRARLEGGGALFGDVFPVAKPPELLVLNDPAVQPGLSGPVLPQQLRRPPELRRPDGRRVCLRFHAAYLLLCKPSRRRSDGGLRFVPFIGQGS